MELYGNKFQCWILMNFVDSFDLELRMVKEQHCQFWYILVTLVIIWSTISLIRKWKQFIITGIVEEFWFVEFYDLGSHAPRNRGWALCILYFVINGILNLVLWRENCRIKILLKIYRQSVYQFHEHILER